MKHSYLHRGKAGERYGHQVYPRQQMRDMLWLTGADLIELVEKILGVAN